MKYKIFLLIIVIILCFLSLTTKLHAEKETLIIKGKSCIEPSYIPPPKPTPLDLYLDKLAMCESGNNPKAINLVDRDGTSSLGRYQFKQSTFNGFSKQFGMDTDPEDIWDGNIQRVIVKRMAETLSMKEWARQFPDCTLNKSLKYYAGYPPTMTPKVDG